MLLGPLCEIGLCGHAENRVFHRSHIALGRSVEDVAHEKVLLRITVRQERGAVILIRVITHQKRLSCYHPPGQRVSCFHPPWPVHKA